MNDPYAAVCSRLAGIRRKYYGDRGKARFARALGIRASTYQHYELDRSPPVDLLVLAARLTGTNLEWLITGEGRMDDSHSGEQLGESATWLHPLFNRVRKLVDTRPDLAQSISNFLHIAEQVAATIPRTATCADETLSTDDLLPVVGSTAAGAARFWKEIDPCRKIGGEINQRMEELLSRHYARAVRAGGIADSGMEATEIASLVQLSQPDELGFVEFLSCPSVKAQHPQAIAWRIDGDSMSPRYNDGDFVIVSPDQPAVDGYPCVAHQSGQIGANCKIYSRSGDDVTLVPVNESARLQRLKVPELAWALRVLYSVRLAGG
jgi:hypothetical protein